MGTVEHLSIWLARWVLLEVLWEEGMDCEDTGSTECRDRSITAKGSRGVAMRVKEDAWVCLCTGCSMALRRI